MLKKDPGKLIHLNKNLRQKNNDRLSEDVLGGKHAGGAIEDATIQALYSGIVRYARLKKFTLAERLKEKMIEIAPKAFTEIVRASEIIQQGKVAGMDQNRMLPFADLYKKFTTSESTAFYYALKDFTAKSNEPVFEQGKFDDRLYFIRSGRLILSYYDSENRQNIDFAILQKGDIAGVDTFFKLTNHTTTLTPIENSNISFLEKSVYDVVNEYPAFGTKLTQFCESHKKTCRIDSSRRRARRIHKRYPTSLKAALVENINIQGKLIQKVSNVTIVDISSGGLCYIIQNMKADEARLIHKKHILISASYQTGPTISEFKKLAKVISVNFHPFGDCSVHVQFRKPIKEEKVIAIAKDSKDLLN